MILLLDNSQSMGWDRKDEHGKELPLAIDELNRGLVELSSDLAANPIAKRRVEVQVITFGGKVQQVGGFTEARNWKPPHLSAAGRTPMGEAIAHGLELARDRRRELQNDGQHVYRPWIFMLTDGEPNPSGWSTQRFAEQIAEAERSKNATFWCIGAQGADFDLLRQLTPKQPVLRPVENDWTSLFRWMSAAVSKRVSVRPGEQVSVDPWTVIANVRAPGATLQIVAGSRRGTAHVRDGSPAQDRALVVIARAVTLVFVADGVGSAPAADRGADAAVHAAATFFDATSAEPSGPFHSRPPTRRSSIGSSSTTR